MNQIAQKEDNTMPAAITPQDMLAIAVRQNADLDKISKLMDLQERWEASEAKKLYTRAMANFQSKLGPIIKTRQGHNSKYADIDDIAQAIRPVLEDVGLSYRFDQQQEGEQIKISCVVTHVAGHSESTMFCAGIDNSGGKNLIQAMASTVTYLRRYTLTGALGITTGQDDNDGGKPSVQVDELLKYNAVVRDEIFSVCAVKQALLDEDYATAKEAWTEVDNEIKKALWRAPTKGGIFTTKEIAQMKSNEWSAA